MRPLPSNIAERGSTERNIHPESLSPSLTPVEVLSASLKKIAIRLFSPMIVPTRVKGGVSGAAGWRGQRSALAPARRRPSASAAGATRRKAGDRGSRRASKREWPTRDLPVVESSGRRVSGVGRCFAVHVGLGALRSRSRQARLRKIEVGPRLRLGRPELRRRRWRAPCFSLGLSPLSGHHDKDAHWCAFRFAKGLWSLYRKILDEKIRHAGFEIVEQRLQ